ncbi:MAG: zinc metallopeptidase, partial [Planctomycetes bacterium]|nr:zinc metallopeptidase [Planctomycetota bacterium]
MWIWDPMYMFYVALPLLLISLIAQGWVKWTYSRYSRIANSSGVTGAQAAMGILRDAGIHDVRVEPSRGWLSDHYDPREKVLRLSPENYGGRSIAAVGIAAHEAGHAIQHASDYAPLLLRNFVVPLASLGSSLGYVAIFLGLVISGWKFFAAIGILLIAVVALFQIINLPVEFN